MEEKQRGKAKKKKDKSLQKIHHKLRSPLQEFNRITSTRINTANKICSSSSNICSSATSVSIDAPKVCLKFLLSSSSNSNASSSSSSSSSSSYSRFHFQKKPKTFSKITNKPLFTKSIPKSAPKAFTPRSNRPSIKENDLPENPSSQSSRKNPSFLSQRKPGKNLASRNISQKSKLSSDLSTILKNPASGFVNEQDLKQKHQENRGLLGEHATDFNFNVFAGNSINIDNSTPFGKLACGPSLNFAMVDDDKPVGEDSNSGHSTTVVKTPPIEASVSPEIQCSGSTKLVLPSTATPVCYAAGHLISWVTDKRKCRSRGILTVGDPTDLSPCGKISVCEDYSNGNDDVLFGKSRPSLTPLPAEASISWLLSPPDKEDVVQKDDIANPDTPFVDSTSICVSSSPSSCCQYPSDLVNDSGDRSVGGNQDATTSIGKTRIAGLLYPRRISNFQVFPETPCEICGDSSVTPQAKCSCRAGNRPKGGDKCYGFIGEKTPPSVNSVSSRNVIQTPTSDSSPDRNDGISWINADDCQTNELNFELSQVSEIFHRISVSSRNQGQMWDPPSLSSQFNDSTSPSHSVEHIQLQKNVDDCTSCMSDTTVGNMSLSQMTISWREGLLSRIVDTNELDCCKCLSDEENYSDGSDGFQLISAKDVGTEECDSFRNSDLGTSEFLELEPESLRRGKAALSPVGTNICVKSISTEAGDLVASEDSDWTLGYKNQSF